MEQLVELQKRSVELKEIITKLQEDDASKEELQKEEKTIAWRIRTLKYLTKVNFQWQHTGFLSIWQVQGVLKE